MCAYFYIQLYQAKKFTQAIEKLKIWLFWCVSEPLYSTNRHTVKRTISLAKFKEDKTK